MKFDSVHITEKFEHFKHVLKQSGIRCTPQRIEIFRKVLQSEDHPDAVSIYEDIRKNVPSVSLDTVYRNLWLFIDLGLITTLGQRRDRLRFDRNVDSHHHFYCTQCGIALDFDSDEFNALQIPDNYQNIGAVVSSHVELRGVCSVCLKDDTQAEQNKKTHDKEENDEG